MVTTIEAFGYTGARIEKYIESNAAQKSRKGLLHGVVTIFIRT
jgi:hypothetical protein